MKKEVENKKIIIDEDKKISKKKKRKIEILNSKYKYEIDGKHSLKIENVYKSYGTKNVLNGVTFEINKGERVALVGKNGSGKSTLISIISQQTRMNKGLINYGYAKNKIGSLEGMGIQFQTLLYPEGFIVKDVIHFFNVSTDKSKRMSKSELSDIVSMFGIEPYLKQKIDRLSGGQQQRINILLAMIKKPKLLILDEISTGLDVESAEKIKRYIESYLERNKDAALLLISHSDEEIRELTERVYVLEKGEIVEEFKSKELTNEKFFKITSREPKQTLEETEEINLASQKIISSFRKAYGEKEGFKPESKIEKESLVNKNIEDQTNEQENKSNKIKNIIKDTLAGKIDNEKIKKDNIIEINDLSKTYGKTVGAIRNISLSIKDGERVAITGPNGSGKTTLVEIMSFVKNYDSKRMKFSNLFALSKRDYEKELEKNKEYVNTELRNLKNLYRIERESISKKISEFKEKESKEIVSLENEKKELAIKLKKDINTLKSKDDSKKEILDLKESFKSDSKILTDKIQNLKNELNIKVKEETEKIQEEVNSKVLKMKEEYALTETKLNDELQEKNEKAKISFEARKEEIEKYKEEVKASKENGKNNLTKVGGYIDNGKKIEVTNEINDAPTLMYSFATTKRQVKDETGVQFQYASFPVEMSVKDVILFFSRTNKYYLSTDEIINAIKVFKLEHLLKRKAYKLSGGERQRLNVLLSIMKSPKILILDEISTGLDVDSIVKIDKFIKEYLDKTMATLILISHNYHEVHSLTDKIVVMKNGKLNEIVNTKTWNLPKVKEKMRDIYMGGAI